MKAIINLTEEEAIKNISQFDSEEINAMTNLCNDLRSLEKKSTSLILTKK